LKRIYDGRNDLYHKINVSESPPVTITPSHLDDVESHKRMEGRNLSEKVLNKSLYRQFPDRAAALT